MDAELILALPEALSWSGTAPTFVVVHDRYRARVSDALGSLLRAVERLDEGLAARLHIEIQTASASALLRVIMAPETSNRLIWQNPRRPTATATYLVNAFLAEKAMEGFSSGLLSDTWTALGDAKMDLRGGFAVPRRSIGRIPLDLDSPEVSRIDPTGVSHECSPWHPLDSRYRDEVEGRIGSAHVAVAAVNGDIAAFCEMFVKVLVLQQDDLEAVFSNFSSQKYPGRTAVSNPQFSDTVRIAEAMVHEAIHAFLYMLLQSHPWGLVEPLFDDRPRVVSPWSGRKLPVSTFLHACFVWYGLLNFWSCAVTTTAFPIRRVRGRMSRAVKGFLDYSLVSLLDPADRAVVAEPLMDALRDMQERVRNCLPTADELLDVSGEENFLSH